MFNSIEELLGESFPRFLTLTRKSRDRVNTAVLQYLFRLIYLADLKTVFFEETGEELRSNYTSLQNNGYLLVNIKCWLYRLVVSDAVECRSRVIATSRDFEIKRNDLPLTLLLKGDLLQGLRDYKRPSKNVADWMNLVQKVSQENEEWVQKLAYFKGRFLTSYGISRDDCVAQMTANAVFVLYLEYPRFDSGFHLRNKYKQAARQSLLKIIDASTSAMRQRLVTEDGTFQSTHFDLSNLPEEVSSDSNLSVGILGSNADYDTVLSVRQLVANAKPKQRRFLSLLSGLHDPEFEAWLADNDLMPRSGDSYTLMRKPAKFTRVCLDFLGVPEHAGMSYLKSLRSQLSLA